MSLSMRKLLSKMLISLLVIIKRKFMFCLSVPSPREEWLQENRDLFKQYGISKPYFIICNQFWIHKDHGTAFKAFAEFLGKTRQKLSISLYWRYVGFTIS